VVREGGGVKRESDVADWEVVFEEKLGDE